MPFGPFSPPSDDSGQESPETRADQIGLMLGLLGFLLVGFVLVAITFWFVTHPAITSRLFAGVNLSLDKGWKNILEFGAIPGNIVQLGLDNLVVFVPTVGLVVGLIGGGLLWFVWGRSVGVERRTIAVKTALTRVRSLYRWLRDVAGRPLQRYRRRRRLEALIDRLQALLAAQHPAAPGAAPEAALPARQSDTAADGGAVSATNPGTTAGPSTAASPPGATAAEIDPRTAPIQPLVSVEGPPMKILEGDSIQDCVDAVRPDDDIYTRVQLSNPVAPEALTELFNNRTAQNQDLFQPVIGSHGRVAPSVPGGRLLGLLPGNDASGHDILEAFYVYWTDHDGDVHYDLLIHDTDGPWQLSDDLLADAYEDLRTDWVSTSPRRILVSDGHRTPFAFPKWSREAAMDAHGEAVSAREAAVRDDVRDPPTITITPESAAEVQALLELQRAGGQPYIARHLASTGRLAKDNYTAYRKVPDRTEDDDAPGKEKPRGAVQMKVGNRLASRAFPTPVGLTAKTTFYCKFKSPYQNFLGWVMDGETAAQRKRKQIKKAVGDSAEKLVDARLNTTEQLFLEEGVYGTRAEETQQNTATAHVVGLTVFDGGCGTHPAWPPNAPDTGEAADHEPRPHTGGGGGSDSGGRPAAVTGAMGDDPIDIGAEAVGKALDETLSGDFCQVAAPTELSQVIDRHYPRDAPTGLGRLVHPLKTLASLSPPVTTDRTLADLQEHAFPHPNFWGYKWNRSARWPNYLMSDREAALLFWPTNPGHPSVTDEAEPLYRWSGVWAEDGETGRISPDESPSSSTRDDAGNWGEDGTMDAVTAGESADASPQDESSASASDRPGFHPEDTPAAAADADAVVEDGDPEREDESASTSTSATDDDAATNSSGEALSGFDAGKEDSE